MMLEIQYFKAATTNIGAMTMRWMTMSFHFTSIRVGTEICNRWVSWHPQPSITVNVWVDHPAGLMCESTLLGP